jgi:hypothetical protein
MKNSAAVPVGEGRGSLPRLHPVPACPHRAARCPPPGPQGGHCPLNSSLTSGIINLVEDLSTGLKRIRIRFSILPDPDSILLLLKQDKSVIFLIKFMDLPRKCAKGPAIYYLSQCCGSRSAWIWSSWVRIRIGNANPDPGARILNKINK